MNPAEQLRIRRCTLRVQRQGGWSWGPDPRQLMQLATQALPTLIAEALAGLLAERDSPDHFERLSLRLPVSIAELAALAQIGPSEAGPDTAALAHRLARSCEQVLAIQHGLNPQSAEPPRTEAAESLPLAELVIDDAVTLLTRWFQEGTLVPRLRYYDETALRAWEEMALEALPATDASAEFEQELQTAAKELSRTLSQASDKIPNARVARMVMLAALLHHYPGRIPSHVLRRVLDARVPALTEAPTRPAEHNLKSTRIRVNDSTEHRKDEAESRKTSPPRQAAPKWQSPERLELDVPSVLPFVGLGVLARLGYFDALCTALKAADFSEELPCWVTAFAFKLLPAPLRGWHREPADRLAAAATSGLKNEIPFSAIDHFASYCDAHLSAADACLKHLLAAGHDPGVALLVHRSTIDGEERWMVMDCQGHFPMGWFGELDALLSDLEALRGNTVLIAESAADPALFTRLERSGHRFVTPVPPAREDRWRPVDRRRRWWTNDPDAPSQWLQNQASGLVAAGDSADRSTRALLIERPVVRSRRADSFEHSLALAASSALGTIAWELWGQEETVDPLLALERLGDLDGRVTFERERIVVRPALGRRSLDLQEHRLLDEVSGLPWFGGRPLEFVVL